MEHSRYLECGKVLSTHGVGGAVKAEPWCDTPTVLAKIKTLYKKSNGEYVAIKVEKSSVFKSNVIIKFENINSVEEATLIKNQILFAAREDIKIKEGSFFIADLIGLDVIDADSGKIYGQISDVTNYGASDIYTVKTASGECMIPAVDEFIVKTDIDKGVYVRPIEGMFE